MSETVRSLRSDSVSAGSVATFDESTEITARFLRKVPYRIAQRKHSTPKYIGRLFIDRVGIIDGLNLQHIKDAMKNMFGMTLDYTTSYRALVYAQELVRVSAEDGFQLSYVNHEKVSIDDSLRTSINTPFKISIDRTIAASIDPSSRKLYGQVLSQAMA
ncbi:hypothetical protein F2Q68_00016451 [Brassica cretica]|uniref:Uncharacterized protein n=1 Tax=Brassica cretica TaxID=69181 RepID=A0A8S9HKI1_BRACR|nr:hypothetical protein F2Q68_00016451 [Brassica cretica]